MRKTSLLWPVLLAILSSVVVGLTYYFPQFQGKKMFQEDVVQSRGASKESWDYYEETGEQALWTNSMFSGMPTYQIGGLPKKNLFFYFNKFVRLGIPSPLGLSVFGVLSFFIALVIFGVNPWLSLFGGITFAYSLNYLLLQQVGHNTKLLALFTAPLILAGLVSLWRKKYGLGGLLFLFGMGFNLYANHYQMTYYFGLMVGIYFLIEAIYAIKDKSYAHLAIVSAISIGCLVLAIGTSATRFITTKEFAKETLRGERIVDKPNVDFTPEEGYAFQEAMQFSNGFIDVLSIVLPKVAGGSSVEPMDERSAVVKAFDRAGKTFQGTAPTYWGRLPFTQGPMYMGIGIIFLFIIGMFIVPDRIRWWFLFGVIFTIIMSMGKNMSFINRPLFNGLPYLNSFRSPNSIISITTIFIYLFSFISLHHLFKIKDFEAIKKPLFYTAGGLGVIFLFFLSIGPGFFDLAVEADAQKYVEYGLSGTDILPDQRKLMMRTSALRSLIYLIVVAGSIFLLITKRLNKFQAALLLMGAIFVDSMNIGKQYITEADFKEDLPYAFENEPTPADTRILQDKELYYRVCDRSLSTFNSSRASYFHKSIGGYHAAKLRRYDDILDWYMRTAVAEKLFNMLNVKYVIQNNEQGLPEPFQNDTRLGNAWFVQEIDFVADDETELKRIGDESFDPSLSALVHTEFQDLIKEPRNGFGEITLTDYSPNSLTYTTDTYAEEFAVFSEIWYRPKGWQAYIDGEPVPHVRANYIFRAMNIPAGKHTVEFKFEPASYFLGQRISLFASIIALLGLLGFGFLMYRNADYKGVISKLNFAPITAVSSKTSGKKKKTTKVKSKTSNVRKKVKQEALNTKSKAKKSVKKTKKKKSGINPKKN